MDLFHKKAPCPYCYNLIDPRRPDHRCCGDSVPGRASCRKVVDPLRVSLLQSDAPVYPAFPVQALFGRGRSGVTCPQCLGAADTRVCPCCHSVLSRNFTAASPLFGLVGDRGSGKTVLLSVLSRELKTSVANRFGSSIAPVGDSPLRTALERHRATMDIAGGDLPRQTRQVSRSDMVPVVYEWQSTRTRMGRTRPVSTILSFYDSSGEDLGDSERAREMRYLKAASGLILVLDPFGFPANHDRARALGIDHDITDIDPCTVLGNVTTLLSDAEKLRHNQRIRRPLAVVVSKIDAFYSDAADARGKVGPHHPIRRPTSTAPYFDEQGSLDLHESVKSLVAEWGGGPVLEMLNHNYRTYRFFAASALGAEPDYAGGRVNPRGVLPHRVAEPLLWLMAIRGFLPVEASRA